MKSKLLLFSSICLSMILIGCGANNGADNGMDSQLTNTPSESNQETDAIVYEYEADLTHDKVEERVVVTIREVNERDKSEVEIVVYDKEEVLHEIELYVHENLGEKYYLVTYNDKDYLMRYKPSVSHDTALCTYEVFSLDASGEKVVLDSDEIEISLLDVEEMDKESWIAFAEKENKYFADAFLLVSTLEANLEYSTEDSHKTYLEEFLWLIDGESGGTINAVLDKFVEETLELYPNESDESEQN